MSNFEPVSDCLVSLALMVPQDNIQRLIDPLQIKTFLITLQETKHLEP